MEPLNNEAIFVEHINNALVGELPSFGMSTESKFQQLMQRNQSQEVVQQLNLLHPSTMKNYSKYDMSLSAEAKAFQPAPGNQFPMQTTISNSINSFGNLNINGHPGDLSTGRLPSIGTQPNPAANEFIPRNISASVLPRAQQNGDFNIPEFTRNRSTNMLSEIQQQVAFMSPGGQFSMQQNMMGESGVSRISQQIPPGGASSPMVELLPGTHLPSLGPMHDTRLPGQSMLTSLSSQDSSTNYHAGDTNARSTSGLHSGKRRAGSRDLKASFRFIEEYVQKFLNRKDSKGVRKIEFKGFSSTGPSSFPYPPIDQLAGKNIAAIDRGSPLQNRRFTNHRESPLLNLVSTRSNLNMPSDDSMQQPVAQEDGGTTYFFTPQKAASQSVSVVVPSYHVFPGAPAHVEYMTLKPNAPSFFMSNDLREAILQKHALTMLTVDTEQEPSIPAEVDNYHSLFPLEPVPDNSLQKSNTFGFVTSCYKAIKYKDGLPYCLRRIHRFRQVNEKCMVLVDMWKKLQHANVVHLREVFTSKAFGEHSLIFAHDYHPGAETILSRHFQNPNNNYASKAKWNGGTARQNAGLLPESLIWTYVVQLTSALRCIHSNGLACRILDPSKIIITDKSRVRINGVGIFDVLGYDNTQTNPRALMEQYQHEDMMALGRVVMALACNSVSAIHQSSINKSMDLIVRNYSPDLKHLICYLLTSQQRALSVNDVMPMIGARFYMQLDAAMLRCDVIENELSKEVENGRLFRMLSKLAVVNERPEFGMEPAWAETGDRYILKLFRDHLFHQVTDTGAPWIDLAHIVHCLNKLDAGVPEKLCLVSRDSQNVLIVSYAELKNAFTKCFNELLSGNSGV